MSTPFRAVLIPVDDPPVLRICTGWKDMVETLCFNGWEDPFLEAVAVGPETVMYVDEDGIARHLPRNHVATDVAEKMLAKINRMLLPGDYIKGHALLVGQKLSSNPEEGLIECDVPQSVISTYFPFLSPRG